jgi:hypothetical protein
MLSYSGYSASEIEDGLQKLKKLPMSEAMDIIASGREYKNIVRNEEENPRLVKQLNLISDSALTNEIGWKVDTLLRKEAGLSTAVAIELLTDRLKIRFPEREVPAYVHKKSFASWLSKLCRSFPSREILFNATAIRNNIVHRGNPDWTLK